MVSANGFAGSVATATTTPAITLSTTITGLLKGNATAISAATAGTDYSAGTSALATGILKSTTTTGALTIAVAADFPTLNQNTTGTAANITASSNSTLTTLSALSLPATQLTGTLQAAQEPAHTGDVTNSAGSLALTLATVNANVGSFGSSTSIPSFTVNGKGLITAASGNVVIAPAGTLSGTTLNSTVVTSSLTSVANNAITNAMSAQMATLTIKGNNTGGTANALDLTVAQVNAILPVFTSTLNGITPLSGGGTTNFLRADGTWAVPAGGSFTNPMTTTGDIIYSSSGSTPARLGIGTAGYVLTSSAGIPSWQPAPGTVSAFFASSQVTTASSNVTSASFVTFSNSPAFSLTPTITGTYKVYSSVPTYSPSAFAAQYRIIKTSGTGTLLEESQANSSSSQDTSFIQSVYTLTAGTAYVFDIQGQVGAGGPVQTRGDEAPFYMFAELITASSPSTTVASIGITIDGGGSVITTGSKGYVHVEYACTINGNTILADQSGSIQLDVKRSTYSGFPTTSSLVASAPPVLSSAQKSQDNTLTGWTTTLAAGDVLEFLVTSVTTVTRINFNLKVTRT